MIYKIFSKNVEVIKNKQLNLKKIMKKLFVILFMVFSVNIITGCSENVETELRQKTASTLLEANKQSGFPNIINFQERKLAKLVMELRDRTDLICHAYIKSDYKGELVYLGKCIGYGLPYGVSFTNPEQYKYSGVTLPQAEPNGLYTNGITTSATWLFMLNPNNPKDEPKPVYVEPEIVVSPFPLHKID